MATLINRYSFLDMPRGVQKHQDLREVFDLATHGEYLIARCIDSSHRDETPSMCIYSDGVSCRGCGRYWWPDEFLRELGTRDLETEGSGYGGPKGPPPSMEVVKTYSNWLCSAGGPYENRLPVLYARGIRRDTLAWNLIGHNGEAFSIPVFDVKKSHLVTIRYRRDDERSPDKSKYWGTHGYNEPALYAPIVPELGKTRRTIIVEGELDALRLAQEGYHAITVTNGAQALSRVFPPLIPSLPASDGYLICTDNDTVGSNAGWDLGNSFRKAGVAYAAVSWSRQLGKDVTDFLNRWPITEFDYYVSEAERCAFGV